MPNYFYTAKSLEGRIVSGTQAAEDVRGLAGILKNDGLFLAKAVLKDAKDRKWYNVQLSMKVSSTEKIMLARNLSIMVATSLSLVKSFDILANQTKSKKLKDALISVRERINKGESMSSSLAQYPDIFSDFFLSMVKVGEESGTLEEVLKILALQLEKEHRLKSSVQGAMVYPVIVLSLLLVVGMVVAIVVLPRLKQFFVGMNSQIPFYTKMLIDFGEFSVKQWPVLIIVPVVLVALIAAILRTKKGQWALDTILLKFPLFSGLVKKNNCAILIRSLSSLLGSGVSLVRSLEVSAGTVGNYYFKKAVTSASDKIKKGEKLSEALGNFRDIFPFGAIEMLEVGEETGRTATVLKTLADFYEDEVIDATAKLSSAIEPMLIIFLGAIVAFFAFSIIQPMYSSLGSIH
ncbi:MAG: type II secretion system F family protein [Candidatus Staskawiczbacteria bacterium]|nr:type II secretion system F family protein [Candidatus Staskawiczbacteria bacterium]